MNNTWNMDGKLRVTDRRADEASGVDVNLPAALLSCPELLCIFGDVSRNPLG